VIDQEVRDIVTSCYEKAKSLLATHLEILHRVARTLLEKEVVDGAEIKRIIQEGIPPQGPGGAEQAEAPA
jgi:cell division protease FtsH